MRVFIPNSAFLGNIDPFIRSIDLSDPDHLMVTGNRRWLSVHPVVITMIASLGLSVGPSNVTIDLEARSRHYLERMGLFDLLGAQRQSSIIEHEPAGRFIPLAQVKGSSELTRFMTEMIPLLHLEPDNALPIKYSISELVRNVLEHSESDAGAIVAAQFYKKSNIIRIGISDTGVGIRHTIGRSHLTESDLAAIRLSLMPGITGATRREGGTEQNAGAGLFFIKSMAAIKRDFFMVYSGDAMFKLLRSSKIIAKRKLNSDPFRDRHSAGDGYPCWRGTVVGIDISLSEPLEFSDLLGIINRTYVNTIRERKKSKHRRPRFI